MANGKTVALSVREIGVTEQALNQVPKLDVASSSLVSRSNSH